MRFVNRFLFAFLSLTLVTPAQTDRRPLQRDLGVTFNSAEIAGREKLVKGAPYQATAIVESTQILADGNRIVRQTEEKVARDSQGRTRHEVTLDRIGAVEVDGPKMIFISDPALKKEYNLNTRTKTVQITKRIDIDALLRRAERREQADEKPVAEERHGRIELRREALGTKEIEELKAEGERISATFPAGALGNERPLAMSIESWYSPDLQVYLLRKRIDPRYGEILYRLTNIQRAEPAPALFKIPAGYKLAPNRSN